MRATCAAGSVTSVTFGGNSMSPTRIAETSPARTLKSTVKTLGTSLGRRLDVNRVKVFEELRPVLPCARGLALEVQRH